ncbi:MAG: nucleotidyltransferase domain-containing protein, partial [Methylobacterium sp.]|nr:nucleotidyltransferase domain-containing protein [Methylobacterium sp.]
MPEAAIPPFPLERVQAAPDSEAARAAFLNEARIYLIDARKRAELLLLVEGGRACAIALCVAQDRLIAALYDLVTTRLYPNPNPSAGEHLAIVAVGGYGRGTLAPGSDTDVLFLLPVSTPWAENVAEAMLYVLWDLGLKIGHSTRTIDECIRTGREDLTIRTALLESRRIAGEDRIFREFETRFDKEVVAGRAAEFAHAKLAERDERIARAGLSRYLVEPNVKEGKGGQRDLQTLFWIAKFVYRVKTVEGLVEAGVFTRRELRLFERCEEFLWRVRCHMHFVAGRAEERLTFDMQRVVAQRMGYRGRDTLSAVERFMKHYFLVAKEVGDLSAI